MIKQFSQRIYYTPYQHETDRPNLGYVRGDRLALMFDGGASPKHVAEYKSELEREGLPWPGMAVLSHWHWDHSFGICALDVPVLAGRQTHEKLCQMARWSWDEDSMERRLSSGEEILFCHHMLHQEYGDCRTIQVRGADVAFDGEITVDLGGVTCRLIHAGGPHAPDSVICYVPEERFVFLGDAHGKDLYGKPWHYDPAQPQRLVAEMDKIPFDDEKLTHLQSVLHTLDFAYCLPGHDDIIQAKELYRRLSKI